MLRHHNGSFEDRLLVKMQMSGLLVCGGLGCYLFDIPMVMVILCIQGRGQKGTVASLYDLLSFLFPCWGVDGRVRPLFSGGALSKHMVCTPSVGRGITPP